MDKGVKQIEFNVGNDDSGEYKVEVIRDSAVYGKESESDHLPGFHYLVSWKRYLEEENIWKPASMVQHLRKLISLFYKDHPDKPTTTFLATDTLPPMARPTVRPTVKPTNPPKQKWGQPVNSINKQTKKNWATFDFYRIFGRIWVSFIPNILSRTVRDYTWLAAKLYQNFFQSLDFLNLLSLSHKAVVFLLELLLGQNIFHQQPSINIFPSTIISWSLFGFLPQSPVIGLRGFSPAIWPFKTY